MSHKNVHPHAEFDRFPALVAEFGSDSVEAIIDAEAADFHWEGRIAERFLGVLEGFDAESETFWRVAILGYFQGRYYTAICIVDEAQRVCWMINLCTFDSFAEAENDFLAGD